MFVARSIVGLVVVVVVLLACGGGGTSPATPDAAGSPAATAGQSAGSGGAASDPASEPSKSTGGAAGSVPAIEDTNWASGNIHAEFSGDQSMTVDAPLVAGPSQSFNGFTSLTYLVGEGQKATTVLIVLDPEQGGSISLSSPTLFAGGGAPEGCVLKVDKNDASGISGTFTCQDMPGFIAGGATEAIEDVTATWSAAR